MKDRFLPSSLLLSSKIEMEASKKWSSIKGNPFGVTPYITGGGLSSNQSSTVLKSLEKKHLLVEKKGKILNGCPTAFLHSKGGARFTGEGDLIGMSVGRVCTWVKGGSIASEEKKSQSRSPRKSQVCLHGKKVPRWEIRNGPLSVKGEEKGGLCSEDRLKKALC